MAVQKELLPEDFHVANLHETEGITHRPWKFLSSYRETMKFEVSAPYFIMYAGHCQRKIMIKTKQQLWDYALFSCSFLACIMKYGTVRKFSRLV